MKQALQYLMRKDESGLLVCLLVLVETSFFAVGLVLFRLYLAALP